MKQLAIGLIAVFVFAAIVQSATKKQIVYKNDPETLDRLLGAVYDAVPTTVSMRNVRISAGVSSFNDVDLPFDYGDSSRYTPSICWARTAAFPPSVVTPLWLVIPLDGNTIRVYKSAAADSGEVNVLCMPRGVKGQ
jgi:hypothetical protein